jgi:hypothetical protein
VTDPAIALAFFDAAHGLHGSARSGVTVLFEHGRPQALPEGPEMARKGSATASSCASTPSAIRSTSTAQPRASAACAAPSAP